MNGSATIGLLPRLAGCAFLTAGASACVAGARHEQTLDLVRPLPFRAMVVDYSHPDSDIFWNVEFWNDLLRGWREEGFNAIIWYGPNELTSGEHMLVRHVEFPEARVLEAEELERRIAHARELFRISRAHGLKNVLMTHAVFFTENFAKAHGLDAEMPASATVSLAHNEGYPDFWRGGETVNCGVRNELTRAYTEAVYAELAQLYPELEGFYGMLGEPLPGDRSTFFREAIVPGLERSGRHPLFIVSQWQVPLDGFLENVSTEDRYDNLYLGFHGYNSEGITDAKPYPGLVEWSDRTGLPTIADIYPANVKYFPFNSPRFAHEIVTELRKLPNTVGFAYWERNISGARLGPLFRKALARYSAGRESYSDDPWLQLLEQEFGSRRAARHLLEAYDIAARIIPETCALVYSGGDVLRRELRMPYTFFTEEYPWHHRTSPARGIHLVPVRHYAKHVASDRELFLENNGSDASRYPFQQQALWGSEGGSTFDVIPPEHMRKVRAMGTACLAEAEAALESVTRKREEAARARDFMKALHLLSQYYERKVAAAVAAIVYADTGEVEHRQEAESLADEVLAMYSEAVSFMDGSLNPFFEKTTGRPMLERGVPLEELLEKERTEREEIAEIFDWPELDNDALEAESSQ